MIFIYPAVFRKKEDGRYHAFFPDLECCEASGDTLDEAVDNANEAARTRRISRHRMETLSGISLSIYVFTKVGMNNRM